MKKFFLLLLTIATFFGCSKLQNDASAPYDENMSSQLIFSQNVSTLQLIGNAVLNSAPFSFESNDILSLSNDLDEIIKKSYPLAFSYPSLTKTKSCEIESVCSLIPTNCIDELKNSVLLDIDEFNEIKARYFKSEDFLCLSQIEQEYVRNYLNTVELCRNTVLETAYEIINGSITKVSVGEMRMWSDMVKNMPKEYREKAVDLFFYSAAGVAGGIPGLVIAGIGLVISWVR